MSSIFSKLFGGSNSESKPPERQAQPLDYEKMILLDAEDLAEQGFAEAYNNLLPELTKYVGQPAVLEEVLDPDLPSYKVRCNGEEYQIYPGNEPRTEEESSWGRATYFFFLIVNKQLSATSVRFYAVNGGNDLGGLFLTSEEAQSAQAALPRKSDWPYLPELSAPWYGQFH
jgi:hypothetical protein